MPLSEVAQIIGVKDMKERQREGGREGRKEEEREGGRETVSGADSDREESADNYYHRVGSPRSPFENSSPPSL